MSLSVKAETVYGFLGPNGAGKTTTLRMLLGLLKPTGGTAEVCGLDPRRARVRAAAKVGALLEGHGLYPGLSGRDNLEIARRYRGVDRSDIDRVLSLVDLSREADRPVSQYSLGMRQRLGLGRALLGAPPVLILDEPTNGLDPDGIAELRSFLRDLPRQEGTTVLLSSHLLSEVEQLADHIGVIDQGRLVLQGELAALTGGTPQGVVLTDAPEAACAAATAAGFDIRKEGSALIVTASSAEAVESTMIALNMRLVSAGIGVFGLSVERKSLSDLFHEVVRSTAGSATE